MRSIVHRWVRQPNLESCITKRVGNRYNPFQNTLTVLEDPINNRKLYLIGTTNSSTTLAYRTRKLLNEVSANALYVQANQKWWNNAKHTSVTNQEDFNEVSKSFESETYPHENNLRGLLFRIRLAVWKSSMKVFSRFPTDFRPFSPGLQTKFALHEAEKLGAKTYFGGKQIDNEAIDALKTQPDMYPHTVVWRWKKLYRFQTTWAHTYDDFFNTLHTRGGEAFAQSIDRSRINFLVALLSRVAPKQKAILVDQRDERIFRDLYSIKQKNIVAVVNQWHLEGVETHWRRATGTEIVQQLASPIADMDIDGIQENTVVNEFLREYTSEVTKSEPATHQNILTGYHKENFEYERTRHTHHNSHQDVPEPGQKHTPHHH